MIEKCAELGVSELQPIHYARSVVEPGTGKLERWRRLAVAAAKQCGAARTMTIAEPLDFKAFVSGLGSAIGFCGIPDPSGLSLAGELLAVSRNPGRFDPVVIFVGPEGGLDQNEMNALIATGVRAVTWAPTVLRIETAAVAAAAVFAAHTTGCRFTDD
jgi:16S rRNA (uracil1498-N3)-methyltransferase